MFKKEQPPVPTHFMSPTLEVDISVWGGTGDVVKIIAEIPETALLNPSIGDTFIGKIVSIERRIVEK